MTIRYADNFAQRINHRVPSMSYAADVEMGKPYKINYGALAAISNTFVVAATASSTGGGTLLASTATPITLAPTWGQAVSITASGTVTSGYLCTVTGRDYLGQRLVETIQPATGATVNGKKAFKYVDSVTYATGVGAAGNFSVGNAKVYGVPYKTLSILASFESGLTATAGTLANSTDTQTVTSNDPRGTIAPNGTPNATITFSYVVTVDETNLHGVAHVTA